LPDPSKPSEIEFCPSQDEMYLALMKQLPPGAAWDNADYPGAIDSVIRKFVYAIAGTWFRFEAAMCEALDEWFCFASTADVDMWSLDYGVPDECDLYNASLCAKVTATHSVGAGSLVDLLEASGYNVEARWLTGDDVEFPGVYSTLRVMVDPYLSTAFTDRTGLPFRLGLGRRLGAPDISPIICMLERYIPAHTVVSAELAGDFHPTDLGAKLVVWWNADDTADGSVTSFTDRESGLILTPVTGGDNPQSAQELVGGYRFINANGVDQALRVNSTGSVDLTNGVLVSLIRQDSLIADTTERFIVSVGQGTNSRSISRVVASDGMDNYNRFKAYANGTPLIDSLHDLSGYAIVEATVVSGVMKARVNGEWTNPDSVSVGAPGGSTSRITAFASNDATPVGYLLGAFRHIFYVVGPTPSEMMKLEAWNAWDIGQQAFLLPPDHPYRNVRP
jgi:hypothetical protein